MKNGDAEQKTFDDLLAASFAMMCQIELRSMLIFPECAEGVGREEIDARQRVLRESITSAFSNPQVAGLARKIIRDAGFENAEAFPDEIFFGEFAPEHSAPKTPRGIGETPFAVGRMVARTIAAKLLYDGTTKAHAVLSRLSEKLDAPLDPDRLKDAIVIPIPPPREGLDRLFAALALSAHERVEFIGGSIDDEPRS
jgi:hypothetical protein